MPYVRQPDGKSIQIESAFCTHYVVGAMESVAVLGSPTMNQELVCRVRAGQVCPHGYRVDEEYRRRDGDGCTVVAVQGLDAPQGRKLLSLGVQDIPTSLRNTLETLEPGASVEVLLDDGRVVATTTRSTPWPVAGRQRGGRMVGQDYLVQLVGFTGGFNLARCRPPGWAGWTTRLEGYPTDGGVW